MNSEQAILFILVPVVAGMLVWGVWAHAEICRLGRTPEHQVGTELAAMAQHAEASGSVGLPVQYVATPTMSHSAAARDALKQFEAENRYPKLKERV